MKTLLSVLALAVLAGCATDVSNTTSSKWNDKDLRNPLFFRGEQQLQLTFPQIQMALIKHRRACGTAPVFTMNEGQTSYGRITQKNDPADDWDKTILIDLMALQANWRQEARTTTEVFSRYGGKEVDQRIKRIYAAINNPEVCPDTSQAADDAN